METSTTKDPFNQLIEMVEDLSDRVLQLESDIYDMKKQNSEMARRVSNLESSRSGIPF